MQRFELEDKFGSLLKKNGLRLTSNRQAIFETLLNSSEPLTIQQIARIVSGHHFVSVYRSIDTLLMAGIVKQIPYGFKTKYELSDKLKPHHHHATCEKCEQTQEIENVKIEQMMERITRETGMRPTKHHFELFGICQNCSLD